MPSQNPNQNSTDSSNETPNEFCCIITGDIMSEPVIAEDGYTYEKSAIVKWLAERSNKSPITRQVINPKALIPNRILKTLIEKYIVDGDNPKIPPAKNKTHIELMQKFASDLKVEYSEVYVGSAVEQVFVGYAGIYESQSSSFYRPSPEQNVNASSLNTNTTTTNTSANPNGFFPNNSVGTTYFQLHLTESSYKGLVKFYEQRHIGLITKKEKINDTTYKITVNTNMLYNQLSPKLGEFKEKSHEDLMKKLQAWLKVDWNDVYAGDAVESTLVKMAGIDDESQSSASFRANADYSTVFNLKLNDINYKKFVDYYQQKFPSLILNHVKGSNGLVKINVNTLKLGKEVGPKLEEYKVNLQDNVQPQPSN